MREIWIRITLAAVFSLMGVLATYQWSRSHRERAAITTGVAAVARIESAVNEVQRRPAERLVWQGALSHQELYPGEAVRTASNAEARIEFLGQGTVLELDPDTVIEIQSHDGAINLDFLKGNLFIRSTAPADKITVKSGEEKIAVANSEVAISKATATAKLDVDVIKGDVKVVTPAGEKALPPPPKETLLKVLSPQQSDIVYLTIDPVELMAVTWEKLDPNYTVKIEAGSLRTELKAVEGVASAAGDAGILKFPAATGKSYLRLVAESTDSKLPPLKSSVIRYEVREAVAPRAQTPAEGGRTEVGHRKVELEWSNPGQLEELMIEIARSRDLKESLHAKRLGQALRYVYEIPGEAGSVFWRVSGRLPNSSRWISSSVRQFYFTGDKIEPLAVPALVSPEREKNFTWAEGQGTIWLKWEPVKGATGYEVTFTDSSKQSAPGAPPAPTTQATSAVTETQAGLEAKAGENQAARIETKLASGVTVRAVTSTELSIQGLKPGIYMWSVIAKDDTGRRSAPSETRRLNVQALPPIQWADGKTSEKIITESDHPQLRLAWLVGGAEKNLGLTWRTRISRARKPASENSSDDSSGEDESVWKVVKEPKLVAALDALDTYRVEVEALSASGQVVAIAPVRTMEYALPALLKAPELEGAPDEPLQGTDTGSAELTWKPVAGAKSYRVTIKSSTGETLKTLDETGTKTSVEGLRTGDYQVILQTIDRKGREGGQSEPRTLRVPEYSDVRAPKLKKVNIN
jgi:hypothetical protein